MIAFVKYWYIFKQLRRNKQGLMKKNIFFVLCHFSINFVSALFLVYKCIYGKHGKELLYLKENRYSWLLDNKNRKKN